MRAQRLNSLLTLLLVTASVATTVKCTHPPECLSRLDERVAELERAGGYVVHLLPETGYPDQSAIPYVPPFALSDTFRKGEVQKLLACSSPSRSCDWAALRNMPRPGAAGTSGIKLFKLSVRDE